MTLPDKNANCPSWVIWMPDTGYDFTVGLWVTMQAHTAIRFISFRWSVGLCLGAVWMHTHRHTSIQVAWLVLCILECGAGKENWIHFWVKTPFVFVSLYTIDWWSSSLKQWQLTKTLLIIKSIAEEHSTVPVSTSLQFRLNQLSKQKQNR